MSTYNIILFLWRNMENYPQTIIEYPPCLFLWAAITDFLSGKLGLAAMTNMISCDTDCEVYKSVSSVCTVAHQI